MKLWLGKLVLAASLLALVLGVMTVPTREARANPWIGCAMNNPRTDTCNGWCIELVEGPGRTVCAAMRNVNRQMVCMCVTPNVAALTD